MDDWVCAFGQFLDDPAAHLFPLLEATPAAAANLAALYAQNQAEAESGEGVNPFWEDRPEQHRRLLEWLTTSEVQAALARREATKAPPR